MSRSKEFFFALIQEHVSQGKQEIWINGWRCSRTSCSPWPSWDFPHWTIWHLGGTGVEINRNWAGRRQLTNTTQWDTSTDSALRWCVSVCMVEYTCMINSLCTVIWLKQVNNPRCVHRGSQQADGFNGRPDGYIVFNEVNTNLPLRKQMNDTHLLFGTSAKARV